MLFAPLSPTFHVVPEVLTSKSLESLVGIFLRQMPQSHLPTREAPQIELER